MKFGISDKDIAQRIGISRQAVAKHRKAGMPVDSMDAAVSWYLSSVNGARRKGLHTPLARVPAFDFDDETDYLATINLEEEPEPMRLDYFAEDFWGESATANILDILGDGSTKAFRKRENVIAAFFCIFAAMRLHLRLMPELMAKRIAKKRTVEQVEAELMEWVCAFASHWFGKDFEREPILPTNINALREFYRALEAS